MSPARLSLLLAAAVSSVLAQDAPKVNDPALQAALFASEPLIQTPIGMTFDKKGRLIVIESHTHFRPKNWTGPEHDQIVCLSDTNSDGKADKREVIFADSDMTMDIATHPDGSLYLSTRNEILRLRDKDGDGTFETVDRKLVWLETEGKYPHNGLSGLAFDAKGSLYFGMGENLGAAYTLKGTDSATFSDQGEGGNIWHCTADGKRLRKIARIRSAMCSPLTTIPIPARPAAFSTSSKAATMAISSAMAAAACIHLSPGMASCPARCRCSAALVKHRATSSSTHHLPIQSSQA